MGLIPLGSADRGAVRKNSDWPALREGCEGTLESNPFTPHHQDLSRGYFDAAVLMAAAACLINAATGAGRDT
jgi:hypothetical protein